jgi:hypothetical protein
LIAFQIRRLGFVQFHEQGLKKRGTQMNEYDSGSREGSQKCKLDRNLDGKIQYLLSAEERLLQSISAGAPLPELLYKICSALDRDIGNMVSLISLRDDDTTDVAAVAGNARQVGLYPFCSAGVFAENDEVLGSLEMYSCRTRLTDSCSGLC